MNKIDTLRQKVTALYNVKSSTREEWADWLAENHIFVVAKYSRELAERFGADPDLAEAAGMLHDIADAVMERKEEGHAEESFKIARELLEESGFSEEEISVVVDDAMRFHSCSNGELPETLEGKVMAAGDALAHLCTDFYEFAVEKMRERGDSEEKIKEWGLSKIDRDYYKKIPFEEVRNEVSADYARLKGFFDKV